MFNGYINKSRIISIVALLTVLLFCVTFCCLLQATAWAENNPTNVTYNSYEVIVAGEEVNLTAQVTRNGVTNAEPIKYTDFPATEMNTLFNSFTVKGYIDGWNEEITQTIIVMPKQTQYMLNFGGNTTKTEYIAPGEGVLGLEFDHSGVSGESEPFFQAILNKFPDLLNKTSAKQYGLNTDVYGNWGYVGSEFVGTAKTTVQEKDLYEKILFPKRGTDDVEVKMELPEGKYDVYIGTYSYWFSRPCNISINGTLVAENYQLMPSRQLFKTTVDNTGDLLTVLMEGNGLYDEAMVSFICVTLADGEYPQLTAPQATNSIQLSDSQLTVSGLTSGAKLVAYDYNTNNLLFETIVPEGQSEVVVTFQDWQLTTSLSRIGLMQVNSQFTSPVTVVQRTDISDMSVVFDDNYTSGNVVCSVSGNAPSKIVQLLVKQGDDIVLDRMTNSDTTQYSDTFEIAANGTYDVVLVSGSGAVSTQTITISKIDKQLPTLSVSLNLQSAKQSDSDNIVLQLEATTLAPIDKLLCIDSDGNSTNLQTTDSISFTESGVYTVFLQNTLGKQVATNIMIALDQKDIRTVNLSQTANGRAVTVNLSSSNGYELSSVTVYATTEDGTEKMTVNGSNGQFDFNMYDPGLYLVQVLTADGSMEVFTLNITNISPDGGGNGITVGDIVGICLLCVSAVCVMICVVLVLKKGKKHS